MGKSAGDVGVLLKEWDDVTRWADMVEAEPAHERAVKAAGLAMGAHQSAPPPRCRRRAR